MSEWGKAAVAWMGMAWAAQCEAQYAPPYTVVREKTEIHVAASGASTEWTQWCVRIESESGVSLMGEQRLSYVSSLEDLEILEAYTEQPDGRRVTVAPDRIRTIDGNARDQDSIYSDSKTRLIIFPQVQVGSVLCYSARTHQHTPYFKRHYFWSRHFSPHGKHGGFELSVTHDPGIAVQVKADRVSGGRVADAPDGSVRYEFRYSQETAHPRESGQLDVIDFAPSVSVTSFESWSQVARAYAEGLSDRAVLTPELQGLAVSLIRGAKDARERVQRIYQWVSANIRYVGVYMGDGGYVPHTAAEVYRNRYGDCKDHAVLLEVLLRAVGVESTAVLVNAGRSYRLPALPAIAPLNHVITYVPELDLYVDATAQFSPLGVLPREVMDKPVLHAQTGESRRTPRTHHSNDGTTVQVDMTLNDDGYVSGQVRAEMKGLYEIDARAQHFYDQGRDAHELAARYLSRYLESGQGRIAPRDAQDLSRAWIHEAQFQLDPVVNVPGPGAMTVPTGLAPGRIKALAGITMPTQRRFEWECPSVAHEEQVVLMFPTTVSLTRWPADVDVRQGGFSYQASYVREGQSLRVHRRVQVDRDSTICSPDDMQHWQPFQDAVRRDLRAQIFFE